MNTPSDQYLDEQIKAIGERVKEERLANNLTVGDLAQAARLPIPDVYQIEAGNQLPNALTLHLWWRVGMNVHYIITGDIKCDL